MWTDAKASVYQTITNKDKTKVSLGSVQIENARNAFVNFAKSKGKKNTVSAIENSPSVSWLKDKLKNDRPIYLRYNIKIKGQKNSAGHAISILGYRHAKKLASGNTYNYLCVYDTWNARLSYINYTTVDFDNCRAVYFNVK